MNFKAVTNVLAPLIIWALILVGVYELGKLQGRHDGMLAGIRLAFMAQRQAAQ